MDEQEFNRQYDAAVERGKAHRANLLIERAGRLKFFVDTFQGKPSPLVEVAAYLVLEAHQTRRRAIWTYICYGFRDWRQGLRFSYEYWRRFWWCRLSGLGRQAAIEKACDSLEAQYLSEEEQ